MGERIRPDRAAKPGKFCIWVEMRSGDYRFWNDFETEQDAKSAACELVKEKEIQTADSIVVYDDAGWFKYKLEKK